MLCCWMLHLNVVGYIRVQFRSSSLFSEGSGSVKVVSIVADIWALGWLVRALPCMS